MTEDRPEPVDMAGADEESTVELPIAYVREPDEQRAVEVSARIRIRATGPAGRPYLLLAAIGLLVGLAALVGLLREL